MTLSKSNLTFGELMREIEKQTNYLFMYRDAEIDLSQKIEVKNTSATVKEILTTALRNKKLTYKFSNNYISLYVDKEKAPETMVTQQERKIKVLIYISTLENHRKAGVGKSSNQSFLFI